MTLPAFSLCPKQLASGLAIPGCGHSSLSRHGADVSNQPPQIVAFESGAEGRHLSAGSASGDNLVQVCVGVANRIGSKRKIGTAPALCPYAVAESTIPAKSDTAFFSRARIIRQGIFQSGLRH